jgi:drug/metabolite transporter (DMT)-like permease
MEIWLVYALSATLLYGTLNFLFKAAAERGHDADGLVNIVGLTVAVMAFGTLWATAEQPLAEITGPVLAYAFFNGLFFALGSLAQYGALKRAPAAVIFPLSQFSTVAVMAIGFVFFHEVPRPVQVLGIVAGLGMLGTITFEHREQFRSAGRTGVAGGMGLALASAIFVASSLTVGKLLADSSANRFAYIGASYSLVFFFTLGRNVRIRRGQPRRGSRRTGEMVAFGAVIGLLNFAGYYLVLQAFGSGPISLTQAIFSSSIIVPILLSHWIYYEKLTPLRMAAIALAILSVVLISLK